MHCNTGKQRGVMLFLPVTIEIVSTWRRRAGGLNPQERRILRDTMFSPDEKALLSRAYHRAVEALSVDDQRTRLAMLHKLVDLGEEGMDDEDMLFRSVSEDATRAVSAS
jgi:hypothetical protein